MSLLDEGVEHETVEEIPLTGPSAQKADAQEAVAPVAPPLPPKQAVTPLTQVLYGMGLRWETNEKPTSTGLHDLNKMLGGGLRPGDVIAFGGTAKGGKSALAGQIAFDAARSGALAIYASVEMSAHEIVSRWLARLMFCSWTNSSRHVSSSDIDYGKVWRGEFNVNDDTQRVEARDRLLASIEAVRLLSDRLIVQHLPPGATPAMLRDLVVEAKRASGHTGSVVLVVDPIQRLFASASRALDGRALDSVNSNETERVGMVSQQIKALSDDAELRMSVIFTSDTTKSAVLNTGSSATSLRGSYQLNHLATTILGIQSADTKEALVAKLEKAEMIDKGDKLVDVFPRETQLHTSSRNILGLRYVYVECSGQRRGPATPFGLLYTPGAMTFIGLQNEK